MRPGEVFAERYRLASLLARGGMGSVWVAEDERLERTVAVKFMDRTAAESPEARARFQREASAAGKLRTPHVVQIHDHGVHNDIPFIVMELLEGEDLDARLKRERRLSLAVTAKLLMQIAKGLRRAHDAGIVHRDLKPQNIFLSKSDDDEIVKILDFGVAKTANPILGDHTESGVMLGSPHYMSPEQTRGSRTVDHRTDLWALGVILFRTLSGELPFTGKTLGDVLVKICVEPIPSASAIASLPAEIDVYFARALARNPDERFQSAHEMADALAALSDGSSGLNWPSSLSAPNVKASLPSASAIPTVPTALALSTLPTVSGLPTEALGASMLPTTAMATKALPNADAPTLKDDVPTAATGHVDELHGSLAAQGTASSWTNTPKPGQLAATPFSPGTGAADPGVESTTISSGQRRATHVILWVVGLTLVAGLVTLALFLPSGGSDGASPEAGSTNATQANTAEDVPKVDSAEPIETASASSAAAAAASAASTARGASAKTRAPSKTRAPATTSPAPRQAPAGEKRLEMY